MGDTSSEWSECARARSDQISECCSPSKLLQAVAQGSSSAMCGRGRGGVSVIAPVRWLATIHAPACGRYQETARIKRMQGRGRGRPPRLVG